MNTTLVQTVQNLPLEEQFELLWEQLLEPLNDLPLPETERLELHKRLQRIQESPKLTKPWREFIREPN